MESSSSTPQSEEAITEQNEAGTKKRRPTERRKLQNRIAQRKYRENLKTRLENLERQAAEIASQRNAAAPDAGTGFQPEVIEPPTTTMEQNFDFLMDMDPGDPMAQFFTNNAEAFEFPDLSACPNMDNVFDSLTQPESSTSPKTRETGSVNGPSTPEVDFEYDFFINKLTDESTSSMNPPGHSDERSRTSYSPWDPRPAWSGGKSPAKSIDKFVRMTPDASTIAKMTVRPAKNPKNLFSPTKIGPEFASELVRQLRLDDSKENHSLVKTAIARNYNIRDVFLAGLSALDKQEALLPHSGYNPYQNTLTLVPTSTLQAFLSNAVALQLPVPALKNEEYQSHFYQPEAFASGNMAALEAVWNDIPKSLQPTPAQITKPHHPWMDMIPFPTLRERALTLGSLKPPIIDIDEFKNDIFLNSGIRCWRVGGPRGSGQPWDMRSWEAEPWFLKKWWILVGGESGEVWEQTEWWRAMRGKGKVEMDGAAK
ncbi:hypothetical protein EG329_010402 [Mollisiaceae sp. DMI_Dod_QoI]|nr:hypothetical protein EG329_010402 [Helotiales sp. DMI_Dod_QoI]